MDIFTVYTDVNNILKYQVRHSHSKEDIIWNCSALDVPAL